jgi:hypothetical protein
LTALTTAAKGRVERANGTLQHRLVKELRLAGISSIADGNVFLESFKRDYNARFGRAPASDLDAASQAYQAQWERSYNLRPFRRISASDIERSHKTGK